MPTTLSTRACRVLRSPRGAHLLWGPDEGDRLGKV